MKFMKPKEQIISLDFGINNACVKPIANKFVHVGFLVMLALPTHCIITLASCI